MQVASPASPLPAEPIRWETPCNTTRQSFAMIDVAEVLKDADWKKKEPAQPESIQNLVDKAGKELPEDYLALLRYSDGGNEELNTDQAESSLPGFWFNSPD
jgi:hypothetical protein